MKNKFIWLGLSFLLVAAMLLASCTTKTTTSTSSATTAINTTSTTKTTVTTKTTAITTTNPTTTTSAGNWWDKLGKPQYGGELVFSINLNIATFDTVGDFTLGGLVGIQNVWFERLTADDWTKDPTVYSYFLNYRGADNVGGLLAQSWEFPDPSTMIYHIRPGIHWQNIPPVNGREFTASDVVWNYHRMLGGGDGFTKPTPYFATVAAYQGLISGSVTALDKYTVAFKWSISNQEFIMETLLGLGNEATMVPPEAVQQWGNLNDWHHAIGTGAFILSDFVSGSSATMVRNPNYWGHDERYPQNQLPYADSLTVLIIPDQATSLAGLRTGKISALDNISLQTAQVVQKSNPKILQFSYPAAVATTVDPRNDVKPFNDIRVREAMQMAMDLPTIAASYYGGNSDPWPSSLTSNYMTGWGYPYDEWPQALKDEYAYNTTQAKQLLSAAGYSNGFNTDIVTSTASDLNLLQVVQSYFSAVGINMSINTMDNTSFNSFVRGKKHDQLVFNSSLGISFEPLRQYQRFHTGEQVNYAVISDPAFDAFYTQALTAASVDACKQIVKDTNQYVTQHHFVISLLTPKYFALCQPWLKGYYGQNFAISGPGGSGSPLLLGFYAPRFFIDQNLKKSMGF